MSKVIDAAGRRALAEYRGGMMFELGCHILDLVIGVLGEPIEVTSINQHAAQFDDTLLDNMLAVLRYPRASATVTRNSPHPSSMPAMRMPAPGRPASPTRRQNAWPSRACSTAHRRTCCRIRPA